MYHLWHCSNIGTHCRCDYVDWSTLMAKIPIPFNKRIRVASQPHPKGGSFISITDADTGEQFPEISSILIRLNADDLVFADIIYVNGDNTLIRRSPVSHIDVTISSEILPVREA
jgi:hypothetical protein